MFCFSFWLVVGWAAPSFLCSFKRPLNVAPTVQSSWTDEFKNLPHIHPNQIDGLIWWTSDMWGRQGGREAGRRVRTGGTRVQLSKVNGGGCWWVACEGGRLESTCTDISSGWDKENCVRERHILYREEDNIYSNLLCRKWDEKLKCQRELH